MVLTANAERFLTLFHDRTAQTYCKEARSEERVISPQAGMMGYPQKLANGRVRSRRRHSAYHMRDSSGESVASEPIFPMTSAPSSRYVSSDDERPTVKSCLRRELAASIHARLSSSDHVSSDDATSTSSGTMSTSSSLNYPTRIRRTTVSSKHDGRRHSLPDLLQSEWSHRAATPLNQAPRRSASSRKLSAPLHDLLGHSSGMPRRHSRATYRTSAPADLRSNRQSPLSFESNNGLISSNVSEQSFDDRDRVLQKIEAARSLNREKGRRKSKFDMETTRRSLHELDVDIQRADSILQAIRHGEPMTASPDANNRVSCGTWPCRQDDVVKSEEQRRRRITVDGYPGIGSSQGISGVGFVLTL